MIENTFDRKRIYANPALTLTLTLSLTLYPNSNPNPKAQLCFRTDEMMSFFDQVYRYHTGGLLKGRHGKNKTKGSEAHT